MQAAPSTPDQVVNTVMVLTQAVVYIADKINTALSATMGQGGAGASFSDYIFTFFIGLVLVAFIMLGWETLNVVLDAGTGTSVQESGWRRLFDTGLVKKWLRFALFTMLGSGVLIYEYTPDLTFGPLRVDQGQIQDVVNNVGGGIVNLVNPIDQVHAVGATIKGASQTLGAYYFAIAAQEAAAKNQAINAARTVWADLHPAGTAVAPPPGQQPEQAGAVNAAGAAGGTGLASYLEGKPPDSDGIIVMAIRWVATVMTQGAVSAFLLFMNLGLDVMIVRCLMFNAIYMMMAYKIAILILPVALVAAYWNHWESILRGVVQVIIITVISLNILADLTAIVVSPTAVAELCTSANAQSQSTAANADVVNYAKKIYASMNTGPMAGKVTEAAYYAEVGDVLGSPANAYVFNFDALFWAPVRVILLMTIMVTLVGKIATVIGDTISGTMTYHRG
jgi:hypothetical protein